MYVCAHTNVRSTVQKVSFEIEFRAKYHDTDFVGTLLHLNETYHFKFQRFLFKRVFFHLYKVAHLKASSVCCCSGPLCLTQKPL